MRRARADGNSLAIVGAEHSVRFREHDIRPFPGGMTPPTWPLVPAEIDGWATEVNRLEARSEAFPEQLAALHAEFERIHPFLEGTAGPAGWC